MIWSILTSKILIFKSKTVNKIWLNKKIYLSIYSSLQSSTHQIEWQIDMGAVNNIYTGIKISN